MSQSEVQERSQEATNPEVESIQLEDASILLKIGTVLMCLVNLGYVVYTAVLIGKLKGWTYSIHCFVLCFFILLRIVLAIKEKKKLNVKNACGLSNIALVVTLATSFTLLTRQAYYHPSPQFIGAKWVLFSLQASIIPLLVGILVMYECSLKEIYKDRYILMIAVLDFADIWDMADMLSQQKAPFITEESPLEIAIQFFCSSSFGMFSLLVSKNTIQELLKIAFSVVIDEDGQPVSQEDQDSAHAMLGCICSVYAKMNSQINQNIPFLIIRVLVLTKYRFVDFDFLAKNVISVILFFLDCCTCECARDLVNQENA